MLVVASGQLTATGNTLLLDHDALPISSSQRIYQLPDGRKIHVLRAYFEEDRVHFQSLDFDTPIFIHRFSEPNIILTRMLKTRFENWAYLERGCFDRKDTKS